MNPNCREYLKYLYTTVHPEVKDVENYIFTNPNVHIWNDMNEPACFEKFDKTFPKKSIHQIGNDANAIMKVEHRDLHNTYGYFNTRATYEAMQARTTVKERPLILSRSYYAGS